MSKFFTLVTFIIVTSPLALADDFSKMIHDNTKEQVRLQLWFEGLPNQDSAQQNIDPNDVVPEELEAVIKTL